MKRIVRLTESDLVRLVKRVINENQLETPKFCRVGNVLNFNVDSGTVTDLTTKKSYSIPMENRGGNIVPSDSKSFNIKITNPDTKLIKVSQNSSVIVGEVEKIKYNQFLTDIYDAGTYSCNDLNKYMNSNRKMF